MSPLVWLPLSISGTSLSITWHSAWTIDTATGAWSASADRTRAPSALTLDGADRQQQRLDHRRGLQPVPGCDRRQNNARHPRGHVDLQRPENRQWTVNGNGTITSAASGLCLDVTGDKTAIGTGLEFWTCNGQSNQSWSLS
jgi:hypothetical protein